MLMSNLLSCPPSSHESDSGYNWNTVLKRELRLLTEDHARWACKDSKQVKEQLKARTDITERRLTQLSECCVGSVFSPKALACNGLPTYLCKKKKCHSQFLMIALFWSIFLSYSLSLIKAPQDEMVYIGWTVNIWLVWDRLPEVELGSDNCSSEKRVCHDLAFMYRGLLSVKSYFPCCNIIQTFHGDSSSCQKRLTITSNIGQISILSLSLLKMW